MAKRLFVLFGSVVVVALVLMTLLWAGQRQLIYLPTGGIPPAASTVIPGARDTAFETDDGLRLEAWFVPAAGENRATVVVFNGNAGQRQFRAPLAVALARRGFSVLLFDYRGYGGNPGRPSERGLMLDAVAVRKHAESLAPGPIVYFGESLGSGVAVGLTVEHPPDALILRSPFTTLVDVAREHYPFLPVGLLMRDRYPSVERIKSYRGPLLVIAGDRDRIIPERLSRRLYEAATTETRRYLLIEGAGHNDAALLDGDTLIDAVVHFVDESLGPGDRSTTGPLPRYNPSASRPEEAE